MIHSVVLRFFTETRQDSSWLAEVDERIVDKFMTILAP